MTNAQCVLCHQQQPQTIDAKGGLHKSEVGCLDCHREHPPDGTQAVPGCEMCHSGEPHYELEQCGTCHTDTHAPLDLKLEGEISAPCLTCHQQQGNEVAKHPSAHTDLACNECHTAHRMVPDCAWTVILSIRKIWNMRPAYHAILFICPCLSPTMKIFHQITAGHVMARHLTCSSRIQPNTTICHALIAIEINIRLCRHVLHATASLILIQC